MPTHFWFVNKKKEMRIQLKQYQNFMNQFDTIKYLDFSLQKLPHKHSYLTDFNN